MLLTIYHGSPTEVKAPQLALCRPHNDYGPGFYCTAEESLAKEWACLHPGVNGYCNEYRLDASNLTIVNLDEAPYGPLNWIALLLKYRSFDAHGDEAARDLFIAKYDVNLSEADIVIGYRADDSYFGIARAFLAGTFTDQQVEQALRLGDLGQQIVLRTQKAFDALTFVRSQQVAGNTWHPICSNRDSKAREIFREMRANSVWAPGKRIYELVK